MAESNLYYVQATVTVDTVATDQHVIVQIWNPSATRTIELLEVAYVATTAPGAGMGFITRRSTARGATPTATVTPTAEHHARREAAPDSGFLIDLATFGTQPTLAVGDLYPHWVFPAVIASGVILPIPRGIEIPPGTGLCFVNRAAIAFQDVEWGVVVREL